MSQEVKTDALESQEVVIKKKAVKKEVTAEDVALLEAGVELLRALGVSEKMEKLLPLVSVWHDKDAVVPVKETVIEEFEKAYPGAGLTTLKDFVSNGELMEEIESLRGFDKAVSKINLIRSFYARRPKKEGSERAPKSSRKTQQISIDGIYYNVNQDFYATLTGLGRDEKVAAILAHPQTKESEVVDTL